MAAMGSSLATAMGPRVMRLRCSRWARRATVESRTRSVI